MRLELILEEMALWIKDGPLAEEDLCIIWLSNVATYAVCTNIEPDAKAGWYDVQFVVLDRIPPNLFGWRIHEDNLSGTIFHMGGVPVAIIPLEIDLGSVLNTGGPDLATEEGNGLFVVKETKDPFGLSDE